MHKAKGKHKADKKHHAALKGLHVARPHGDEAPTQKKAPPDNPLKGLQDALKAQQVAELARQVAAAGGGQ